MNEWVIGADMGATKIAFGLVAPDYCIVAHERILTGGERGPAAVVADIVASVRALAQAIPSGGRLAGLGLCAPGPLDHRTGRLMNTTNLPLFADTPLRDLLESALGLPVSVEHDAKGAALGELYFGAGQGRQDMVYLIAGTGVGAAIIMEGNLVRGTTNGAGEVGHISLDAEGEPCVCGSRGCVERYATGPAIERAYLARTGQALTGADITERALAGEAEAIAVLARAGEALGRAVATMAMILDVDFYILGGSVAKAGELILGPLRQTAPRFTYRAVGARLNIQAAQLGEDAPILGGAWAVRQKLLT